MSGIAVAGPGAAGSPELISSFTGRVLARMYRRFGALYPGAAVGCQLLSALPIAAASILILTVYMDIPAVRLAMFAGGVGVLTLAVLAVGWLRAHRMARPIRRWIRGERDPPSTRAAWEAAIALPGFYLRTPFLLIIGIAVPAAAIGYLTLHLSTEGAGAMFVLSCVVLGYAAVVDYFALEGIMRPVVADIAASLPPRSDAAARGVSLKTKLLVALPFINVVTGVLVAALRSEDSQITSLAVDVLIATAVALSFSLVLVLRVVGAMLRPVGDLQRAAELVEAGRLDIAVPVTTGDEVGGLARAFNRMVAGLAERERIREAFGTFVDPHVAEHILANPDRLAGEDTEVTVMFLDVRDFTTFAESAPAPAVVETLNRLFGVAVPIIARHGGHIDKFVGDGLMAVFGAPRRMPDHPDHALAAAREIDDAIADEFGDALSVGIGLNSGRVVAGSIGAEGRLEYSVIGDVVNVAARVEATTRETGDTVLLTETTMGGLRDRSGLERRGEVRLRGRRAPVVIYAPAGVRPAPEPRMREATAQ